MNSLTIRPVAVWLLGLSAVLILGGVSLLLGAHPIALALPAPGEVEVSVAYSSDLVLAVDGESWVSDRLSVWGGMLLVGGLTVSTAAAGLRWGRIAHPVMSEGGRELRNRPVGVLLLGVGLLVVGLVLAGIPGLMPASTVPHRGDLGPLAGGGLAIGPLGIALLTIGVGLGAGVVGHLFGSRRPTI